MTAQEDRRDRITRLVLRLLALAVAKRISVLFSICIRNYGGDGVRQLIEAGTGVPSYNVL